MVLALFAYLFALVEQWVFSCACVCYALDGKLSFFTHFFSCTQNLHLFIFWHTIFLFLCLQIFHHENKKARKLEIHMSFHITHTEVILWAPNLVPNSFYLVFWSKTQFNTSLTSFVSICLASWMPLTKLGDSTLRITLYFNPNNLQKPHTWNDLKHIVVYHF